MKRSILLLSMLVLTSVGVLAQPYISYGETVSHYIENVFLGEALSISNITVNGLPGETSTLQVAEFQSNGNYLPLSNGLVLSTGDIVGEYYNGDSLVCGENSTISVTQPMDYTDADLDMIINAGSTNDEVVIEFDVVPEFQFLTYNYVFASEEYPEYVNNFNDGFGFFISGPGITGPYENNAINVALIPGTDTPVSIDNVNNGNFYCPNLATGPCMNCDYYIDNCSVDSMALSGMTTVLPILVDVVPGDTYHIKMAIGDALDTAFDSAIFLQAFSFKSVASVGQVEIERLDINIAINPIGEELILQNIPEDMSSFRMLDMQGRIVIAEQNLTSDRHSQSVFDMDSGIYFLLLTDESGQVWTQKLVKE